jgi:Xaa-Pro aminopeptidase
MNNEADIRIKSRVSDKELERRWNAVRLAMKRRGLDFLIMQNCTGILGGYVKWFTDLPVRHNYPGSVIFPREEEMTTIWHGARPPAEPAPPVWSLRGVKKRLSMPYLPSFAYSKTWDAQMVVDELLPYKDCRIGWVGLGFIPAAFYNHVTKHLDRAKYEDATDMVDEIKAIKSDEELRLIRQLCAEQDEVIKYAPTVVRPGRREYEVHADVLHRCNELGCIAANVMIGSAPAGKPAPMIPLHFNNRMIQDGDTVFILVETNSACGIFTEVSCTISLGKPSYELTEQYEVAKQAQQITLDLLKPGASPKDIWNAHNAFLRKAGYKEEARIYAHGMGYDMVERPNIDPSETMIIKAGMNLAVHPNIASDRAFGHVCENYLVRETGIPEHLHKSPQNILVL